MLNSIKKIAKILCIFIPLMVFMSIGILIDEIPSFIGFSFVFYLAFGPLVYLLSRVSSSKGKRI